MPNPKIIYFHTLTLVDSGEHSIEVSYFVAFLPPLLASAALQVYSSSPEHVDTRLVQSFQAAVEHNSKGKNELRSRVAQNQLLAKLPFLRRETGRLGKGEFPGHLRCSVAGCSCGVGGTK